MNVLSFDPLTDRPGLEVVDRLERQRYRIHTPEPVDPNTTSTDGFRFPVGDAVEICTDELVIPNPLSVTVRDHSTAVVAEIGHLESESLPAGSYVFELHTQIKTYLEVDTAVEIDIDLFRLSFEFEDETPVRIGARSRHDRPAETVTTTSDPEDMMAAVETFGSALKTLSPERSYPTLRGHPPDIELGDSLSIPDALQMDRRDVTIQVPPAYDKLFAIAPLSYYLGAGIVPGPGPRLRTASGFEYSFISRRGFEEELAESLKQIFFLDCLTRTEGYYEYDLHERRALENDLDLDFETLYDSPLGHQVEAYLSVSFDAIEDYVPEWRLTAHVTPEPSSVELLPFVVDDLAVVRSTDPTVSSITASRPTGPAESADETALTRSIGGATAQTRSTGEESSDTDSPYVQPVADETLEQAWIGDRIPIGASKLIEAAFHNRFERELTDGSIRITIAVNDSRMAPERDIVNNVYGDRTNLPFEVTVHHDTTVEELRELLSQRSEFLHYIGHTDRDGFECADGKLDASTVEHTGVESFLLNACNSYNQGVHLVEAGAIGGIVTLSDIINDGAVRIGESVAWLLNAGFPLHASLQLARTVSVQGGQYIVVGDGGMSVTQAASRTPNRLRISPAEDEFDVEIRTFATDNAGLGSIYKPHLDGVDEFYLSSGTLEAFTVQPAELERFLQMEDVPIRVDGELLRSSDVTVEDLR